MKTVRLFTASLFLTAFLVFSNSAQTNNAQSAVKIVFINTFAFADAKTGINKYLTAIRTLENEFKPVETEPVGMDTKLQSLAKEIQTFRDNAAKNVPVN